MKKLLIILAVLTFYTCDESNEMGEQYFNLYAGLEFSIVNLQNEDLLDPENPNRLDVDKIKLFYEINGEKQEVYNPNYDNPRNFTIFKHANEYRIGITLNHTETSDKPITYVQWNESDTDTIEAIYVRTPRATIQEKLWLNGDFIWELGDNTIDPYFVLTK